MARELSLRIPAVSTDTDVKAIAGGTLDGRVAALLIRGVATGEVPILRAVALLAGAAIASVRPLREVR